PRAARTIRARGARRAPRRSRDTDRGDTRRTTAPRRASRRRPLRPAASGGGRCRRRAAPWTRRDWASACHEASNTSLWNDDDVAGPHEKVFLWVALGDLSIVEGQPGRRRPALPEHHDAIARGEVRESVSERDHLQPAHRALQL